MTSVENIQHQDDNTKNQLLQIHKDIKDKLKYFIEISKTIYPRYL